MPRADSDPNRGAPPSERRIAQEPHRRADGSRARVAGRRGNVGGYNSFWIDPGDRVLRVDGQPRSSIIIDPPDGRVPALTPRRAPAHGRSAPQRARRRRRVRPSRDCGRSPSAASRRSAATPGRRCCPTTSTTTTTPSCRRKDHVMILTEMVHDARVVRIGAARIRRRASGSGWATRSAAGRATRWWSRPPTSIRSSGFRGACREPEGHRAAVARDDATR